jgi:hypothetical protein
MSGRAATSNASCSNRSIASTMATSSADREVDRAWALHGDALSGLSAIRSRFLFEPIAGTRASAASLRPLSVARSSSRRMSRGPGLVRPRDGRDAVAMVRSQSASPDSHPVIAAGACGSGSTSRACHGGIAGRRVRLRRGAGSGPARREG